MHEQYVCLKNLYFEYGNQVKKISKYIKDGDLEELQVTLEQKERTLRQILNQEAIVDLSQDELAECKEIKGEIAKLERENIEKLTSARDDVQKELNIATKSSNLYRAYAVIPDDVGEIFDSLE